MKLVDQFGCPMEAAKPRYFGFAPVPIKPGDEPDGSVHAVASTTLYVDEEVADL